jgi:23S rRNA (guanine745-N1)-methyltransferase
VHPDVLASLRCPRCGSAFAEAPGALRCARGHAFDVARQGYVSFLSGRPARLLGDDAAMVDARARFLAAGHLAPLAEAIAARAAAAAPGLVVELGAGTAYYLARALDALPGRAGLALDLSRHAARRAARAHPRAAAVVADLRLPLPLAGACAGLLLDVFAPRNAGEMRRILRDDGTLLVATPDRGHLAEARAALGLLDVDPEKERRLGETLEPRFRREAEDGLGFGMRLRRDELRLLAGMGPSARHLDPAEIGRRIEALADPFEVTAAVRLSTWRAV